MMKDRRYLLQQREKKDIGNMIRKEALEFRELADFWLKETDPSEKTPHIKNLGKFLEDEGHRTIALCMLHEKQLKWATAKDLYDYLNKIYLRNMHMLEVGDFNFRLAADSATLRQIHQRLINTYKEMKGELKKKDPKIVYENGGITKI